MIILLTGPHGAGKGTIAAQLEKKGLGVHVSSGNLMRSEIEKETELGKSLKKLIAEGKYASDDTALKVVTQALEKLKDKNVILDGYPRNLEQAQDLEKFISHQGKRINLVLNITADTDAIIERMANRLTCPKCQAIYNKLTARPKIEDKCDKCGFTLIHRDEDSPATMKQRLALYEKVTQPMIEFYREKKLVVEVENIDMENAVEKAKKAIDNS